MIFFSQWPSVWRLAGPAIVSQLGLSLMILVDSFFVGKLGPAHLGGVGMGSAIFYGFTLFCSGSLLGLDYLVARAFGAGEKEKCRHWLVQGTYLSLFLCAFVVPLIYFTGTQLEALGVVGSVAPPARDYLQALSLSLIPVLVFTVFRLYLAAQGIVRVVTFIVLLGNLSHLFFNWVLVWGNLGIPSYGAAGAGLATTLARMFMLLAILTIALARGDLKALSLRFRWASQKELLKLGVPSGLQMMSRSAVFSVAATWAGRLGAVALAAHTVAVNLAGLAFMIPLAISFAASVLVGQASGRGETVEAKRDGWASISLSGAVMALAGVAFLAWGEGLIGIFSGNTEVIVTGKLILVCVALFQISDAVQTVATGALRGLGETRSAFLANIIGFWILGLPLAYLFAFKMDHGILGLWAGLTVGLTAVSALVLFVWAFDSRKPKAVMT